MAQEPKGRRRADLCLRVPGQSAPHSREGWLRSCAEGPKEGP